MHRFPFRSFFLFSLLLAGSSYAGTSPERIVADVNAAGDIVGEIRNPDGTRRAVLVRQGKLIELGALGGGESFATAINQDGAVIGGARLENYAWHAFIYRQQDGMRDLGTLGGRSSQATALNRAGHIVGYADVDDRHFHAFLHDGKGMKDLGTFGGKTSYATAINAAGQVVGAAQNADGYRRAFLYSADTGMRELPTLGGRINAAMAINDHGMVVGASETPRRGWHAFLYDGKKMIDIGSKITLGHSYATGINNNGAVVGLIRSGGHSPITFVYEKGQVRIVGKLSDLQLTTRITDEGEIIGAAGSGRKFQAVAVRTSAPPDAGWKPVDWLTFFSILPIVCWALWHVARDLRAWMLAQRRVTG